MKSIRSTFMTFALFCMSGTLSVFAATDHSTLVKGPFKTGEEVTKTCLKCHTKQAGDFIKTTHWTWKGTPNHLNGKQKSTEEYGKANMLNAVCTSIEGGKDGVVHEQCSKCHAGYGWTSCAIMSNKVTLGSNPVLVLMQ